MTDIEEQQEMVMMGRISGLFGVKGWVKIYSHTNPRENILQYNPWYLEIQGEWKPVKLVAGQRHGKGVVVQLEGCTDRDAASALVNVNIAVPQTMLPTLSDGEVYWSELEGLKVVTIDGVDLGVVDHLIDTGANDVLVVKGDRERLIPYVRQDVVTKLDLENGLLEVDWDPDF